MPRSDAKTRVALIGAGFIAQVHLAVMRQIQNAEVVAICDTATERAQSLADQYGIENVYATVSEMTRAGGVDAVHVLVPPDAHFEVARRCLQARLHCLIEKPLATSSEQARELRELAEDHGVHLAVNHNMIFHPLQLRLHKELLSGGIGRLEQVSILHSMPLRQLEGGDLGHYMFRGPANILFEQGVHLFSLIEDLLGECESLDAGVGPALDLPHGAKFHDRWSVQMNCERGSAQVTMGFGRRYPESSLLAVGSDGEMRLDFVRGSFQIMRRSRWPDFLERATSDLRCGFQLRWQGIGKLFAYAGDLFGLGAPRDHFLRSMMLSLQDFYRAVRSQGRPTCDARQGEKAVDVCERVAQSAGVSLEAYELEGLPEPGPVRAGEVLITGGSGLIGRALVPALLEQGHSLTLLLRRPQLLPRTLRDARIRYLVGDAGDPEVLAAATTGVSQVIHMATCAGDDPDGVEAAMSSAARVVGEACLRAGVERLIFVSSSAAIYLGGSKPITGACGADPKPKRRAAYARGKIAAEFELQTLVKRAGLPLVILRPAIVVGRGAPAEHTGLGLWVSANHCVGWGTGRLSLPFLLVEDCAAAIAASLEAKGIDGKAYNLAGDVRLTAREYLSRLRDATGRAYRFHPQPLWVMGLFEWGKLLVKILARRPAVPPSMRDFKSRAFRAVLDCSDAKQELNWQPESDPAKFKRAAIDVHASRSDRG